MLLKDRSNRSQVFFKISVLKKFRIFTRKNLCQSLFNKVAGLEAFNFIKKKDSNMGVFLLI